MTVGKVEITGGFVLLWTFLFYIEAGQLLWPAWVAALCHELGHWIALRLCGGRVEAWSFTAGGVSMRLARMPELSYAREIISVLAGPMAGIGCALLFCALDGIINNALLIAGMCVAQSLFNLLPSGGLDGGRILRLALQSVQHPGSEKISRRATLISAWFMAAFGAVVFVDTGYNITFLAAGAYATFMIFGSVEHYDR